MEEVATNPAPEATPRSCGWATASLVLGIAGLVLCFIIVPSLLAVIFGIIALVQIGNSQGLLTGKGKAIAGIIMGGVALILLPFIAIVAAIAIPNLLTARTVANEYSAIAGLKTIATAEQIWRQQDVDGNGINDYWTYDISCLNRMQEHNELIDYNLARADSAPAPDNAFFKGMLVIGTPTPKNGYFFRVLQMDENGEYYRQNEVQGTPATHPDKFAFVAYPAQYQKTGHKTFIINDLGTVYSKDTGGEAVLQWPANPPTADGWNIVD